MAPVNCRKGVHTLPVSNFYLTQSVVLSSMNDRPIIFVCHSLGGLVCEDSGLGWNHRDMARFEGPNDAGFVAVCGELCRWVRDMNSAKDRVPLESQASSPPGPSRPQPSGARMHSNNNRQYNASGSAVQHNVHGHYFNANRDQNFGTIIKGDQHIHQTKSEPHVPHHVIHFQRNEAFVHRDDILEALETLIPHSSQQYQSAALHGLGGSGKTQVALYYAYRRCDPATKNMCSVFWVNADTEATFVADYKAIARRLKFSSDLDGEDLLIAVNGEGESQTYEIHKLVQEAARYRLSTDNSGGKLAVTYHAQGRYAEDEEISVKVLDLRRQTLGEMHPDTIYSMASLAATYHAQGRYVEAEPIRVKALDLHRQALGEMHPDTIYSMASLAGTYYAQGRYVEAEQIQVKALDLRRQALGEMHPDTIHSMASLAVTYYGQGRYAEAEPIQVKALELRRQTLGEMHPATIRSMSDLAVTYHEQGRYVEAEPIKVKALDLRRQAFGEMHPDTIRSMTSLAATYHAQGRYVEAEPMKAKALDLCKQTLGEMHPDTIRSMTSLAATYHAQGRYVEAEPIQAKALDLCKQILGEIHPDTIRSMQSLAATYYAQGRYAEDEQISVKVLDLRRQTLGEMHPDTLHSMYDLSATWSRCGRLGDSITLMEQCLDLRRTVLGSRHPFTIETDTALRRLRQRG
ncbi:unnamed protein product [Parascedosporium putredinis]|uniref:Kinesin light chain n=1 Tax=Parascedosporium putredinis TaxID=1442378 RepID=A0A9P1H1P7_9PEZI|nr:unnamed protein product [Parascedosporium putredinis]CAI7993970.1 unnamed protein product [Parascedosporium putredinis]